MPLPLVGAKLKAADLAAIFPQNVDGWMAYTPTLTQSATVSKTVEYARYMKIGRLVVVQISVSCTSAGTAANGILVGLPVDAVGFRVIGSGYVFDASAGLFYAGVVIRNAASAAGLIVGNGAGVVNVVGAAGFTAALATGDVITMSLSYETS